MLAAEIAFLVSACVFFAFDVRKDCYSNSITDGSDDKNYQKITKAF